MLITIRNEGGETHYDINNIKKDTIRQEATVMVQKVGQIQVQIEALSFAYSAHRANLEELLKGSDEAIVTLPTDDVEKDSVES